MKVLSSVQWSVLFKLVIPNILTKDVIIVLVYQLFYLDLLMNTLQSCELKLNHQAETIL